MQIPRGTMISLIALAPLFLYGQGSPADKPPAPPTPPVAPSILLQPALTLVDSTLNSIKIDKWKKGSIRDEAGQNITAILNDLKTNLPPLLADADAAPGALSKSIPLMKHLDALYDVLLRVEEGARVSAPGDQVDQLAAALKKFGSTRIELYDSMQQRAGGQEKQVADLQAAIKAQEAAAQENKHEPAATPVPCTPPKPTPKKKRATPPKSTPPAQGQPAQTPPAPPAQPKPQ
jgi:hypothetical protein